MIQPDSSFCTVIVFELTLAVFFPWKHEGSGHQKRKGRTGLVAACLSE